MREELASIPERILIGHHGEIDSISFREYASRLILSQIRSTEEANNSGFETENVSETIVESSFSQLFGLHIAGHEAFMQFGRENYPEMPNNPAGRIWRALRRNIEEESTLPQSIYVKYQQKYRKTNRQPKIYDLTNYLENNRLDRDCFVELCVSGNTGSFMVLEKVQRILPKIAVVRGIGEKSIEFIEHFIMLKLPNVQNQA